MMNKSIDEKQRRLKFGIWIGPTTGCTHFKSPVY